MPSKTIEVQSPKHYVGRLPMALIDSETKAKMAAIDWQEVMDRLKYDIEIGWDGTERWYLNGKLHREDGPAVIYARGTQMWYSNNKLHREDGPAIIYADGTQIWYRNGQRHREDGPAIIYADGTQNWYHNGECIK
jgi:hypothetical protein